MCKVLNISHSIIVGRFSSNIKSQLRTLDLSQSARTARTLLGQKYGKETIDNLEKLLFLCCSLQHLNLEGLLLTPKMAVSICKNGKTLQVLNLNNSHVIEFHLNYNSSMKSCNLHSIIKCCQELKELALINGDKWLNNEDLEFLVKNISPNVVKLNLSNHDVDDDKVKILLSRCNKIKVLSLKETIFTNSGGIKYLRQE